MSSTEKRIQNRLYNLEVSVPDDMWNRIEKELPKKNEKKIFFWFFLVGFILLGSGLFLFNENESFFISSINSPISETSINKRTAVTPPFSEVSAFSSTKQSGTLKQTSGAKKTQNKIYSSYTTSELNISENSDDHSIHQEALLTNQSKQTRPLDIPAVRYFIENRDDNISEANPRKKESVDNLLQPSFLPLINMEIISGPECPPFTRLSSNQLLVEFYYGNNVPIRSFSARNSEVRDYAIARKNTESILYSFSGGVRLAYLTSNNYGIKAGVNYTQINEQFAYIDPDAYQSRTVITIDTIFAGGIPTIISDTSFVTIPGTQEVQSVNRYRTIDIPIIGTYEFNLGKKFYYSIDLGVFLNLSFSQKGRYLDESGAIVNFSSDNPAVEHIYQSNVGISFYGGLAMFYNWRDNVDLFISPSIRYLPRSFTTDAYALSQKYYVPSLNLGIRYKIK